MCCDIIKNDYNSDEKTAEMLKYTHSRAEYFYPKNRFI